jgi:hypothetical protein
MPIYRLEPIESFKDHNDWRASEVGPMAVWLYARDADDARLKMQLATITTVEDYPEGQVVPYSPWLNSLVVGCDEDNSRDVPEGMALLGNGRTIKL